jgi:pimeloyl-ACP methyl ester carboxylesterase
MSQPASSDMIVLLPGIMGSVLAKNGRDLWNVSLGMVARALQRETLVRDLSLQGDDPERPILDDGVVPTRVMADAQLIPGFWKVDGYSGLIASLSRELGAKVGDPYTPDPDASLFPFPYDWRRDNRSAARRLQAFVEQQLPIWRRNGGGPGAKLILIGHSMGGLVARYYLECLGGHEHCRALFTFGTPHRGSLNALNSLVGGQKLAWIDVSTALRSFTSAYQLLPIYEVVQRGAEFLRPAALGSIGGLVPAQVAAATTEFHAPIEAAARTRSDAGPGYLYTAIVGTQQATRQSARLDGDTLTVGDALPELLLKRSYPEFGDGTVPLYAAMPPGARADRLQRVYVAETHAALQNNPAMQRHLIQSIKVLQSELALLDAGHFGVGTQPGLRLIVEDAYPPQGGMIRVQPADLPTTTGSLHVTITELESGQRSEHTLPFVGDEWHLELERPTPGAYRVRAELLTNPAGVQPVQDLFEVVPPPTA